MTDTILAARPAPAVVTALKEWALVCDLLLSARMTVLFRKGGIDEKGFWVEADDFWLFPTYFHQNREKVRGQYRDDFDRALAEAPPDGAVAVPGWARVVEAVEVRRPEEMAALADLHPYTDDQIEMRLSFRPRKPLVLLAVQTFAFGERMLVPTRESYAGCASWVSMLELPPMPDGHAVVGEDDVRAVAARLRATVG